MVGRIRSHFDLKGKALNVTQVGNMFAEGVFRSWCVFFYQIKKIPLSSLLRVCVCLFFNHECFFKFYHIFSVF